MTPDAWVQVKAIVQESLERAPDARGVRGRGLSMSELGASSRKLQRGDRLGPYEVVGPLGAGGMGEVYRARDSKLRRDVAIKVLPPAACATSWMRASRLRTC